MELQKYKLEICAYLIIKNNIAAHPAGMRRDKEGKI